MCNNVTAGFHPYINLHIQSMPPRLGAPCTAAADCATADRTFGYSSLPWLPRLRVPSALGLPAIAVHGVLPLMWILSTVRITAVGSCCLSVQGEPRMAILASPCPRNKARLDLTLEPTVMPPTVWVGRRHDCVDRGSDLIMPLPDWLEGAHSALLEAVQLLQWYE